VSNNEPSTGDIFFPDFGWEMFRKLTTYWKNEKRI
jgi:hypothetical protein